MTAGEPTTVDEQYTSLLAACEEALKSGSTLDEIEVPPDFTQDLQRDLACVGLLRQVLPACAAAFDAKAAGGDSAPNGTRLGRFEIQRELGRGSFGIVYLAFDTRLGREVALKIPRINSLADPELRKRFQREAETAAGLNHANLVTVYEADQVGPICFIASEYCPGVSLARWLKERDQPVPFRLAADLIARLADAIDYAHRHGVVHRDLKPANVLLVSGGVVSGDLTTHNSPFTTHQPKITDFGLARLRQMEADATQTGSGALLGTPSYMAPEQAAGKAKEVGPAADIYALGVMLYELLTGRPPFLAESVVDTLLMVRIDEPVHPSRLRPKVPRDLETICLKSLAKEPLKRFGSAADLAADLRRFLKGEPVHARPVPAWERALKWARRRPMVAALAAMIFLVSALGFAGVTWQWQRAEKMADELDINLYFMNVALAEREWSANNMHRADQLLKACPQERRGWEWHYVMHLRHGNPPPFQGHTGVVHSAAFSPDTRLMASASEDKTVKVWDANTGEIRHTFPDHENTVRDVAFFPDSRRLVSVSGKWAGSGTGRIIVWDTATGGRLFSVDRPVPLRAVAVSPDGQRLATAGWDATSPTGMLEIWDATSGAKLRTIDTPPCTNGLAFSPDGRRIALASGNVASSDAGAVTVWEVSSGAEILTLRHPVGACQGVAFSPDGKLLASGAGPFRGDDGEVKVWDAANGRTIHTLRGHAACAGVVAFTPDSRRLASAGRDKKIKIWDMVTGLEALTLHGHKDTVWSLNFSSDGYRLVSSSADQTVRIWDATPLDDMERGAARAVLSGHIGRVNCATFSPDGRWVASAGSDQSVRIWDAKTGRQLHELSGHGAVVVSVAFSPDSRILASAGEDRTVRIWDVLTGQELPILPKHISVVESVSFSPDGRLATAGWDRSLRIWDPSNRKELLTLQEAHTWKIECVAFSPDGDCVASASSDCTAKVWNSRAKGPPVWESQRQKGRLLCVAFSPNGRRLVFCGLNQTATVVDLDTKKEIVRFKEHTDQINGVAFSPDGPHVASASHDATIRIWEAETGTEVAVLRGHTRWVNSVAYSADGKQLVSAGAEGAVMIWDAPR